MDRKDNKERQEYRRRRFERKSAERNMRIHFTDEKKRKKHKYENFIFNNCIFLDPSLLLKNPCNNSEKKMFFKDAVIISNNCDVKNQVISNFKIQQFSNKVL